ncbi:MAG: hypothetical protein HOO00_07850 [Rhodospirillaceae bacterium]|nr:hypothetical protein [Rhodospirillaceae bacterium]
MSTVGPPTNAPPVIRSIAAPVATTAFKGIDTPLLRLSPGTIINGSITGHDAQGHAILRTSNGVLSLVTNHILQPGNTVSLQVQSVGAQLQMIILSINDKPPTAGGIQVPSGKTMSHPPTLSHQAAPAGQPASQPASVVTTAGILTATLIGTSNAASLGGLVGSISGNLSSIPGLTVPGPISGPSQVPSATPTVTGNAGLATGQGVMSAVKGTHIEVRLANTAPATGSNPATVMQQTAANLPAGTPLVAGTVSGSNATNQSIIQTPIGLLSLDTKAALPRNSIVILEILRALPSPAMTQAGTGVATDASVLTMTRDWPALRETIAVLSQSDPSAAHQLTNSVLPRPGAGMTTSMLFLFSALNSGDIRSWMGMGPSLALEKIGRGDLLKKLGDEFSKLSKLSKEPSQGEWRSFLIPVFDEKDLNPLRIYLRHKEKDNEEEGLGEEDTRFLIDLDLSNFGPMQLDGLVRPKSFELIIRTQQALSGDIKKDINDIYRIGLKETSFSGELTFKVTPNFVKPPSAPTTINQEAHPVEFTV